MRQLAKRVLSMLGKCGRWSCSAFLTLVGRVCGSLWNKLGPFFGKALNPYRRIPKPKSLKMKLTLGSSVLAIGILIITYWTLSYTARAAASRQAHDDAVKLSTDFAELVAESLAAGDRMQVFLLAERAKVNTGVYGVAVIGRDGKVLYDPPPKLRQERYSAPSSRSYAGGIVTTTYVDELTLLHVTKNVRFGTKLFGEIHLWLNRTELESRIREANAYIYPIMALGFILMLLLGTVVVHAPFRALKRLTAMAERIGAGDLSGRVPVRGRDEVATFCQAFNTMVQGLSEARAEIRAKHLETIRAMISTVEAKDSYTQGHCLRVQGYTREILEHMEEPYSEERPLIETAALLHDVGKIGIPDGILLKHDRLNESEVEIIRTHVTIGEKILMYLESMQKISRWVRHHHERWDGLGYPDGLRGSAIPFPSRIIAVADSMDAMLTDRPYRKALAPEDVTKALMEGRGKQYDPKIADCAVKLLQAMQMAGEAVYA